MKHKVFLLVGDDGKALTSVDRMILPDDAVAFDLRDAIKEKCPNALSNVDAADLTVFANGVALEEDLPIGSFGGTKKDALIVQVPKQHRAAITIDISQVNWNIAPEPCPPLLVRDDDQLIELPPSCVGGTGIGRPDQVLILYRRPPRVKQWNEMNRCSIQTYARLWVVGPPGTGKSCAALAFAWSLDRLHWDVIWIHYSRDDTHFNCVWLQSNNNAVCVVKEEAIERDLTAILNTTSQTGTMIVLLDGYVKSSAAGEAAHLKCLRWHQQDKIKHRLVCVCSMAAVGKEHRPELSNRIPTNVDEELSGMEDVEMVTLEEGATDNVLGVQTRELHRATQAVVHPVHTQMLFELTSWCFEDYKEAVLNDDFFRNVVAMIPQADPKKEVTERIKVLQEKYFAASGSARLMFEVTTAKTTETLDKALVDAPNIETYHQGFVADSSTGAVNRLLARYDSPPWLRRSIGEPIRRASLCNGDGSASSREFREGLEREPIHGWLYSRSLFFLRSLAIMA